ncbi:MAG TPA: adenosylcobinamide-phosphate synthase CbiB [Candidatus Aquabacterium excrementipullorum]|nr:adenosylcobinamide-phosphate synthase CbiB [Candidatus Aquabacterium excrementipullorum]
MSLVHEALGWLIPALLPSLVALLVDRCWGEPPNWAHPVVWMGHYLGLLGPALTRLPPSLALLGGAMAWLFGALLTAAMGLSIEILILGLVVWHDPDAGLLSQTLQALAVGLALKPLLAWRLLRDEVAAVERALAESAQSGRERLSHLVSRDVQALDAEGVRESAIESLAENLNDSVVAPLFWFALGGLAGAALYRFANTADAMWGYRGRYEWAGKWAARVDDALSWLPARITAFLLCLAAGRRLSLDAMRREAAVTPSPNGGWPMGTMALLLNVRLRKPAVYTLHASAPSPAPADTARALAWCQAAVWWALACGAALALLCTGLLPRVPSGA